MAKFLAGLIAGVLLVVFAVIIGILALARLGEAPPSVSAKSILVLDLDGQIVERAPATLPLPFLEERVPLTVTDLWRALRTAETDTRIKGVILAPGRISAGWAKSQQLRESLVRLSKTGKPVLAFLRTPSTREYYLATAAGRIYMPPEDMLDMKGLRAELLFFRGTLDKLGVQIDIVHAGKYKDFGDMFTRTSMSPETREVLDSILDQIYGHLIDAVAAGRNKEPAEIRATINEGPFLAKQAIAKGLVDGLLYEDQVFTEMEKILKENQMNRLRVRDYIRAIGESGTGSENRVALVVGEGAITGNLVGGIDADSGIEARGFNRLLRQVERDAGIKGVIVRIDSPGGESFASDEIWRGMNQLSRRKPMVISMSDEAASGGYYMAMTGDPVVAYPATYTGSIGVVFGKANLRGLYEKLGIRKQLLTRGRFAAIDSDYEPLDETSRRKLREGVDDNYEAFVGKVADARKRKFNEIEPLAQGRVWLGSQAKDNGLVDELGGLDRAIQLIRQKARIPATEEISLVVYPPKRSLLDLLLSRSTGFSAPSWAELLLKRWPAEVLARGGYFRLAPVQLLVE